MGSIEDWYDAFRERLTEMPISLPEKDSEIALALQEVRALVYIDPVASDLYSAWYQRVEPAGDNKYSIGNVAVFCLMSAASGIVGNIAYDTLKALVRRIANTHGSRFDAMVTEATYEELRHRMHSSSAGQLEVSEELTITVRRRYQMIVGGPETSSTSARLPNER